ncbi:hypothetical protein [Sediminibacterium sp. TEGAF015]|uniref:hypothetical protein n=1 Tax=Sediminibacterium sp. TEGAF015 TaxID=575378 RepID=UPI00222F4D66|nr:hypothetical protein [Sediminibacterium sp. TEGAF015]
MKFAEIKFEKIIFMLFIKQISKSLCFLFFFGLIFSCKKSDLVKIDQSDEISSAQFKLTHKKINEAKIALNQWRTLALQNIALGRYSNVLKSYSTNEPSVVNSLVADPNFVNLLYHSVYGNLSLYDEYAGSMNTTSFNQFISAAYQVNASLENIFEQNGQSSDPFIANMSLVLADAALINYNNTDFNQLSQQAQIEVVRNAIDFYFQNDPTIGTPPSGIQLTNVYLNEISSCLFDAVGGMLIGNYKIIRDIYGALTGSPMGYAFVYNMAGRILKQAFNNAGGWVGISISFAWCMVF